MDNIEILDNIQNLINSSRWEEAQKLIHEYRKLDNSNRYGDMLEIFQATIDMNNKDYFKAENSIQNGLRINIKNYELYFMLGNIKEIYGNKAQALFAYENAVFYCNSEDKEYLVNYLNDYRETNQGELPGKVAIIITSYRNLEYLKFCIESIQNYNYKGSYEIIVIDNHSNDDTKEWLETQSNIAYVINDGEIGLSTAYNQGIAIADKGADICLLNQDTVVMPNSIFNLRMGLYEDKKIAATGAVSNQSFYGQQIEENFGNNIEEYLKYCNHNNIFTSDRHVMRVKLNGFAVMYKRTLLEQLGYFDEKFEITSFDDDMSIRLLQAGFKLIACYDSFIYSFGVFNFSKKKENDIEKYKEVIRSNQSYFEEKWGINFSKYCLVRDDIICNIRREVRASFNVLEIGCGCGANLLKIKSVFKAANVFGIESVKEVANLGGALLNIEQGDVEAGNLNFPKDFFDYIILPDTLEQIQEPEKILKYLREFLKKDGIVLASIHNKLHHSVIIPLLKGSLASNENTILDTNNLRFYTKDEIIRLFMDCNYTIFDLYAKTDILDQKTKEYINELSSDDTEIDKESLHVYQYLVEAIKN